jgi:hypothetical protein
MDLKYFLLDNYQLIKNRGFLKRFRHHSVTKIARRSFSFFYRPSLDRPFDRDRPFNYRNASPEW